MTIHGPQYEQSLSYSAKEDRQLLDSLISGAGVVGISDLIVSSASGMNSAIAAGKAFVKGTTNPDQALYHEWIDVAQSVTHVAADPANPRLDSIYLVINDATEVGSGSNNAVISLITGTPTPGATLANRSGAGAAPASSLLLADVLVHTTDSSSAFFAYGDKRTLASTRSTGIVSAGKSLNPGTNVRTNTVYGTMTVPDQVSIVMPTNGVLCVLFQAAWQESVSGSARAGIFLGANQVKRGVQGTAAPITQEADLVGTAANDALLTSYPLGLVSGLWAPIGSAYGGDVITGQSVGFAPDTTDNSLTFGGPCYIFAAAGPYTVSVQFKASSGSVTVKNRKLWVWSQSFVG